MPKPKAKGLFKVCPKSGRIVGLNVGSWWACAFFPLIGFLALLWVVVRVGPKPSRAAYPCQRAALPLASGFIVWLLGMVGWLALSGWLKSRLAPRRRAVLAVGGVSLAVLALWMLAGSPPPPAAAATPTEGANAPIGIARGIHPGRVVWCRDPGAAHWSQATGTHWWDPDQTDQARVDAMMSQGLRALTGAASDAAAWDALFRHLNQRRGAGDIGYAQSSNKKIVVKINQNPANESNNDNYAKNGCKIENAITGNPHLIRSLIAQLVNQAGAQQADITVYDASGLNRGWGGPRTIADNIYQYTHAAYPGVRFMDGVGKLGREKAAWPAFESVHYVTGMSGNENESKGKKIVQQVLDAGFMINMAIMKSHGDGPTLCAKNHYGTVDGQRHGPMYGNSGYYSNFVQLMGHQDLGEKTVLFMIDTLYGSSGPNNVPSKWAKVPFNGDWPSSVILSQDGVAIDSVGFDFLNAEFGQPQNTEYHLHDAAYIPGADGKKLSGVRYEPNVGSTNAIGSLGVHEHWNNAVDRKYTRNLGAGNGIELVTPTTLCVTLRNGYNLIALPVAPWGTPFTAESLAQHIADNTTPPVNCTSVIRYDGGAFVTHPVGSAVNNFGIAVGTGYFVRCAFAGTETAWTISGFPLKSLTASIVLSAGYNLIGLPRIPASPYSAEAAGVEINGQTGGSATQVIRYDAAQGNFVMHPVGTAVGNFSLLAGEGYFIRCVGSSIWNLNKP